MKASFATRVAGSADLYKVSITNFMIVFVLIYYTSAFFTLIRSSVLVFHYLTSCMGSC